MIDVQVLQLPYEDKDKAKRCFESIRREPVRVIKSPGILNDILKARYEGFQKCRAEFVSSADPDDIVLPGGFQACMDHLKANPDCHAVYTNSLNRAGKPCYKHKEWTLQFHKERSVPVHQLFVVRRTIMLEAYEEVFERLKEENEDGGKVLSEQRVFDVIAYKYGWDYLPDVIGYQYFGKNHYPSSDDRRAANYREMSFRQKVFTNG